MCHDLPSNEQSSAILKGKVCPYCGKRTQFVKADDVKVLRKGMIYFCYPCWAWVGVHAGTKKSFGRLADRKLRRLRAEAHRAFDQKWSRVKKNRNDTYGILADVMGLKRRHAHFGMFNEEQCNQVIELCEKSNQSLTMERRTQS